jgi:hypothetical protein
MSLFFPKLGLSWPFCCRKSKVAVAHDPTLAFSLKVSQFLQQNPLITYQQFQQWASGQFKIDRWTHLQSEDSLLHLLYYMESHETRSPWFAEDAALFQEADRSRQCTRIWLNFTLGAVLSLPLGLWGAVREKHLSTMTACVVHSMAMGIFVLVAVGGNLDGQMELARRQHIQLLIMKDKVQWMACRLFLLSQTNHRLAFEMAKDMKIDAIENFMQQGLSDPLPWNLSQLRSVCHHIQQNPPRQRPGPNIFDFDPAAVVARKRRLTGPPQAAAPNIAVSMGERGLFAEWIQMVAALPPLISLTRSPRPSEYADNADRRGASPRGNLPQLAISTEEDVPYSALDI